VGSGCTVEEGRKIPIGILVLLLKFEPFAFSSVCCFVFFLDGTLSLDESEACLFFFF
jgi:hypothetical protein